MMATTSNAPAIDDFHKLLLVVRDLALQLDESRLAATKLKLHADLLKEHLRVCNSTDSPLSLPETTNSISENGLVLTAKEPNAIDELVSERDELVRENAALRQENQELAQLLKEYEKSMETTTSLIRDHAFNSSIRTTQLHKDYNQKLQLQTLENERLQNSLIDAEAKLIKVSGLLRQAHTADHEADRNVDQALLDLQTQNRGLRMALGLPVETPIDVERDLVFLEGEEGSRGKG